MFAFCLQENIRILCLAEQLKSVGPMLKGCGVTSKLLKILLRQKGEMTQELQAWIDWARLLTWSIGASFWCCAGWAGASGTGLSLLVGLLAQNKFGAEAV